MKQHNHIKSNRPTRSQSPGEFFITAASLKMLFLSISDKGAVLRNCCGNCVFFSEMKCQKARHSIRKNCPFRKSGRKISPYIFFHLCFHLDGSMSLNGNVPLIVMYIFYFKPQTNHQLTPPARVVFCSRQFIPSPKKKKIKHVHSKWTNAVSNQGFVGGCIYYWSTVGLLGYTFWFEQCQKMWETHWKITTIVVG